MKSEEDERQVVHKGMLTVWCQSIGLSGFGGRVTRVCDGNGGRATTVLLSHEARAARMGRRVSDKTAYNQKRGDGQLRTTPGKAVEAG